MQSTDMARIVVLGAGFAGLWAAIAAARKREEIGAAGRDIEIRVIDRNPYHNIRVRNYEADLSEVALPLPQLLDPIGVSHGIGEVEAIDPARREISLVTGGGDETLAYDRLVLALGSEVMRPEHSRPCRACFRRRHLCSSAAPRGSSHLARTQRARTGALDDRRGRRRLH